MKSARAPRPPVRFRPVLGVFALVAASAYVGRALQLTGGHLSPPLDDTWIYLQYARRLAEGHGMSYSGTAPASTGATSWLHLLLLVPGWWAGLRDTAFLVLPLVLGVIYLFLTLDGVFRAGGGAGDPGEAGGAPADPWPARIAVILIVFSGTFLWAALSGMDTALYAAGLSLTLAAMASPDAARRPAAWIGCGMLPWLRPEGALVGFVGCVMLGLSEWLKVPATPAGDGSRGKRAAAARGGARAFPLLRSPWPLVAVLLLVTPFLLNYALTGQLSSDGFAVKSVFGEPRPEVRAWLIAGRPGVWFNIVVLFLTDFHTAALGAGAPGIVAALLIALLAGSGLLAGLIVGVRGRRGLVGLCTAAWFPLMVLIGGLAGGWNFHHFRYQIPTLVPAALLIGFGWSALARWRSPFAGGRVQAVVAGLAALLLVPGAVRMCEVYGLNCANIRDQQERVGRWIAEDAPPDAVVALNDAGAIAYFGGRPTLDLVGLTSHGWATAWRAGEGELWERLENLPAAQRPTLFAIYPSWFPQLASTQFLPTELLRADLANNTICGDRLAVVYRPDWSFAGRGELPLGGRADIEQRGLNVVDDVDVADAASEAAHDYRWRDAYEDLLREHPWGEPEGPALIEGGRRPSVGESFRIRARPHAPLTLTVRTQCEANLSLAVRVNGRVAGTIALTPRAGVFAESSLQIPPELVGDTTLVIDVRREPERPGSGYESYHYWVLQ